MNKHIGVVFLLALILSVAVARTIKPASAFLKPDEQHQEEEYTVTFRRSDPQEAVSGNMYHHYTAFMKNFEDSMQDPNVAERSIASDEPQSSISYNITSCTASIVPKGIADWRQLGHWKRPVAVPYTMEYKNMFGITVINFRFQVVFIPGGQYESKGQFLAGIAIIPTNVDVTWSYNFNCRVEIPQSFNVGESADDPIAAAQINLSLDFDKHKQARAWFVKGNGDIDEA